MGIFKLCFNGSLPVEKRWRPERGGHWIVLGPHIHFQVRFFFSDLHEGLRFSQKRLARRFVSFSGVVLLVTSCSVALFEQLLTVSLKTTNIPSQASEPEARFKFQYTGSTHPGKWPLYTHARTLRWNMDGQVQVEIFFVSSVFKAASHGSAVATLGH